jgi:hypothetical protein
MKVKNMCVSFISFDIYMHFFLFNNILILDRNSKDLTLKYKLMPLLNKFAGKIEKNEEFV